VTNKEEPIPQGGEEEGAGGLGVAGRLVLETLVVEPDVVHVLLVALGLQGPVDVGHPDQVNY